MSMKAQFISVYKYNFHTTNLLLDKALGLDPGEVEAKLDYGRGSILQIFQHLLRALHSWRLGLETRKRQPFEENDDFNSLAGLRSNFSVEEAGWLAYLDGLTEEDIDSDIELLGQQRKLTIPRWRILQHVAFHGMQHHSELAHLLTERGHSPGDLDYIFFNQ